MVISNREFTGFFSHLLTAGLNSISSPTLRACPPHTRRGAGLWLWTFFLAICAAIFLRPAYANGPVPGGYSSTEPASLGNRYVTTEIITDVDSFQAQIEESVQLPRIGVLFRIEPGWHIYWKNSGDVAIPTKIQWHLPPGWEAGELKWPVPNKFYERSKLRTYGYHEEVLLFSDLTPPAIIPPSDQTVHFSADVSWLVCKDICVPGKSLVEFDRTFGTERPLTPSPQLALFDRYSKLVPASYPETGPVSSWNDVGPGLTVSPLRLLHTAGMGDELSVFIVPHGESARKPAGPEQIQLFPLRSGKTAFGEPRLYGPAEIPDKGIGYEIRLPFTPSPDETSAEPVFPAAVIAFSPDLAGNGGAQIEWDPKLFQAADQLQAFSPPTGADLGELTFRTTGKQAAAVHPVEAPERQVTLLYAIWLAFLGGLLLNLMPCVLPIISIKVLGFIEKCCGSRREAAFSAGYFSFGIIATMCALAAMIVGLRSAGMQVGWGFQLQHPGFVAALTLIIFTLALGLFEVYHFALPCQFANRFAQAIHHPAAKHSFDGVLTVMLSTPCIGPALGAALAYAFTQSAIAIFAIFIAIGCGLSLPYFLFSVCPPLLRLLPRPGAWMTQFRQIMGFMMLITVIWLLTVMDSLTSSGVNAMLILMFVIYFLFWIRKQSIQSGLQLRRGRMVNLGLLAMLAVAVFFTRDSLSRIRTEALPVSSELIKWEPYSGKLIDSASAAKVPLFIDFTAAWCLTCKANERLVIETEKIAKAIAGLGIRPVKADWTSGDPEITAALEKYGAAGVPLYVVVPKNGAAPIVLPPLLTTELLLDALKNAVNS